MYRNLFTGFKMFTERLQDSVRKYPYFLKRAAQFNIKPQTIFNKYDALPVPPNIKIGHDETGHKDPGSETQRTFQYDPVWLDRIDWKRPPRFLKVVDISGKCDSDMGMYNKDHQERPCSPTSGRSFLVSLSVAQHLNWPIPPGQGGGMDPMGGGSAMGGGGMGGGAMGSAMPGIGAAGPAGGATGGGTPGGP